MCVTIERTADPSGPSSWGPKIDPHGTPSVWPTFCLTCLAQGPQTASVSYPLCLPLIQTWCASPPLNSGLEWDTWELNHSEQVALLFWSSISLQNCSSSNAFLEPWWSSEWGNAACWSTGCSQKSKFNSFSEGCQQVRGDGSNHHHSSLTNDSRQRQQPWKGGGPHSKRLRGWLGIRNSQQGIWGSLV
jgi:hypothetical protein